MPLITMHMAPFSYISNNAIGCLINANEINKNTYDTHFFCQQIGFYVGVHMHAAQWHCWRARGGKRRQSALSSSAVVDKIAADNWCALVALRVLYTIAAAWYHSTEIIIPKRKAIRLAFVLSALYQSAHLSIRIRNNKQLPDKILPNIASIHPAEVSQLSRHHTYSIRIALHIWWYNANCFAHCRCQNVYITLSFT